MIRKTIMLSGLCAVTIIFLYVSMTEVFKYDYPSVIEYYASHKADLLSLLDEKNDSAENSTRLSPRVRRVSRESSTVIIVYFYVSWPERNEYLVLFADQIEWEWLSEDRSEETVSSLQQYGYYHEEGLGTSGAGYERIEILDDHCLYVSTYYPT